MPRAGTSETPHTVIQAEDFRRILAGNKFADIPLGSPLASQLVLPPDTTIVAKAPTSQPGSAAEIKFENRFCTVVLQATSFGGSRGLDQYQDFEAWSNWRSALAVKGKSKGPFRPLAPSLIQDDPNGFVYYTLSTRAEFNAWRPGHPDLPSYKRWVQQLFSLLRHDWDEEAILQRTRDRIQAERMME